MTGTDRDTFVADRRARWDRLEHLLARDWPTASEWSELAGLYRSVCADLARARSLGLSDDVTRYTNELAGRAHNALYGIRLRVGVRFVELLAREFPRELRAQWMMFALANTLFYGPFVVGIVGSLIDPSFATRIVPAEQLAQMEEWYANSDLARGGGEDAMMAGFYISNNVGIAFRCFATGILGGLGSMFFLVYNGLVLGTMMGYLTAVGKGGNLLSYVCGHSAWELTAIVVSGTAGLKLGWSLVETGGRTRATSLRTAGPGLFKLVSGAAAMLFVAAAIEGFWSAGPVPVIGKYLFALVQIGIVAAWLALGGRDSRPRGAR